MGNLTTVYFVRHSKPDFSIHDDTLRPLCQEGIQDCKKVTEFLLDKKITQIFSSPFKRAYDTVKGFAESATLEIEIIEDFRERKVDDVWIDDFNAFTKEQWANFDYKFANGECLNEVQKRNIAALHKILREYPNENIVVGTHGTALSTILNYYDKKYDYKEFVRIKDYMPYIVIVKFDGVKASSINEFIF
jgi:2,3-bisphosphoglycerate-dependent phosphoglycerate mutase